MNLDNLKVFTEKENMAGVELIQDVRDEKASRTRQIQVNTAKRVIRRFWVNKEQRQDVGVMTDTDQIAMFKDYYETQIEAVMAREIEIQEELSTTQRRNEMQKNRIEMLDKKVEELRGKLSDKEDELREMMVG